MENPKFKWSKRQWENYYRIHFLISYAMRRHLYVAWATFTSCDKTEHMQQSFQDLTKKFHKVFGIKLNFIKTVTSEGVKGVYHVFFITEVRIPKCQDWLSAEWSRLTGAHHVWITELKGKNASQKVAFYQVNQYQVGQGAKYLRTEYSRFEFMGVKPLKYLKLVKSELKDKVFYWTKWKVRGYVVTDAACNFLLNGFHVYSGRTMVCNQFTEHRIQFVSSDF